MSSSDSVAAGHRRWRLDLAYDGAAFQGFAIQPGDPTVVGLLRSSLQIALRLPDEPFLVGAGRTDTGVHAHAQVVHVDLPESVDDATEMMRALNGLMRGDARVLRAQVVPDDFHARYSAQWRAYRYIVIESMRPISPLLTKLAWSVPGTLDVAAMNRAGSAALGVHDFRAFCKRPSNKAPEDPLIRDILHLEWRRVEDPWGLLERGSALVLDIRAKSFCHNMVRCLTSAMVAIGQGKLPENEVAERLVSLDRYLLPGPAPAAGLALVGVGYPEFAGGPAGFLR